MKTRKIRLIALLVLAAMMILTIPVISSAEELPANAIDSVQGTLNESLDLSFRFFSDALDLKVEIGGKTVPATLVPEGAEYTVGGKTVHQYDAIYKGIGPQNLTDVFTFTIKDGEEEKFTTEYSAIRYLATLKNDPSSSAKLLALVDTLLYYSNEAKTFLGRDDTVNSNKQLCNWDFDVNTTGTDKRTGESAIVDDGTGNKVWQSKAKGPYGNYSQQSLISNGLAGMVKNKRYSITFRYQVVSAIGTENTSFKVCYGTKFRQAGSAIVTINNPVIGEWVTVSAEFTATGFDADNPNISLDYNGLGENTAGSVFNIVWIDDVVINELLPDPGFKLVSISDFDASTPGVSNRGLETGASAGVDATLTKALHVVGYKAYTVVSMNNILSTATNGARCRLTFRYKVDNRIGEGAASFNVCYAAANRYAGETIQTVSTETFGEWQTATVDFVYDSGKTAMLGLTIACGGLGVGSETNTYSVWFDDFTITEVNTNVPAGEKVAPANAGDAQFKSANVLFDSQNKIVVKYTSATPVTAQINGVDVVSTDLGEGVWQIETDGISPVNFDKTFTFTVGTSTLTYSVNDYALAMSKNAKIGGLANAVYAYGVAAEAYVAD